MFIDDVHVSDEGEEGYEGRFSLAAVCSPTQLANLLAAFLPPPLSGGRETAAARETYVRIRLIANGHQTSAIH
jgi:hypothetical protein